MLTGPRPRRQGRIPPSIHVPSQWRRRAPGLVLALVLLLGIVCSRSRRETPVQDDWTRYHDRSFPVTRVVDGDTLDIGATDGDALTTRIRLWGVDAPEVGHGRKPGMYFGPQALAFAERTLARRSVHVVLWPERTRGKYGRLLAYVFLERGGRMFNELLLEGGFGYADLRFEHPYEERFEAIEKAARKGGKGLWAEVTVDQMPEWRQRRERPAQRSSD